MANLAEKLEEFQDQVNKILETAGIIEGEEDLNYNQIKSISAQGFQSKNIKKVNFWGEDGTHNEYSNTVNVTYFIGSKKGEKANGGFYLSKDKTFIYNGSNIRVIKIHPIFEGLGGSFFGAGYAKRKL